MKNEKIWLSSPHIGNNELNNVQEAFNTNWIAPLGPFVDLFESKLSTLLSNKYVAAVNSGTSAIHLALILAGVQKDDIVFCQSFTFSASANPIVYLGAIPVFIDSEFDTWNMCPTLLEDAIKKYIKINKKPKAIIPVHLYGMPAKMKEIIDIANKYDIIVIEDSAEALGSYQDNQPCGTFGNFSILSFNGNKIITTSSGGALVSNDIELINKAKFLATQARDPEPHYQHSHIGYNYRMSNVLAAIGVGQLDVLESHVNLRRNNYNFYNDKLSKLPGVSFQQEYNNSYSNRWLSCILIDTKISKKINREIIRLELEKENIESRPLWKPMHLQPIFSKYDFFGNNISQQLFDQGLCLPSGSNLGKEQLNRICDIIINLFQI
jgi:dTDP-4-amino-4,6-dideoxygalactose transaminase